MGRRCDVGMGAERLLEDLCYFAALLNSAPRVSTWTLASEWEETPWAPRWNTGLFCGSMFMSAEIGR